MSNERTNNAGKLFSLFVGFRETSWELEYRRSIVEITRQTAIDNESALDWETLIHIVTRSIDHTVAQFAIARDFAQQVGAFLNETFGLDFTINVTGYSKSCIHGRVVHRRTDEELIAFVEAQMAQRCGFAPDYATPLEGIELFEWLLWCAETLEHPDPDYVPGDEVYCYLAQRYQQTGAVVRHVRAALNSNKLNTLLSRPVEAILERVLRG